MMHIAFCTDTNYVMPCGVAMTSICENNKDEEITFHLVITDEGTAPDEFEKKVAPLRDIAEKYCKKTEVYRMDAEKIKDFVCTGESFVTPSAFSRIFLPEILSKEINKVLYFDCDLVCDGNLIDLWNTDLAEDCPIGAIVDSNYASPALHNQAQIPQSADYINSGILLMNLDCWRKNNYVELSVNTALEKKFPLLDQDMLNYVFCGKIKYLPVKYNVQTLFLLDGIDKCHVTLKYYEDIKTACKDPVIIHYVTANKPWSDERCPLREIWQKYLNLTIWRNFRPTIIGTRFDRCNIYEDLNSTYWSDPILFKETICSFLRFFRAAVKLKNKKRFAGLINLTLNSFAFVLEKAYFRKTRK